MLGFVRRSGQLLCLSIALGAGQACHDQASAQPVATAATPPRPPRAVSSAASALPKPVLSAAASASAPFAVATASAPAPSASAVAAELWTDKHRSSTGCLDYRTHKLLGQYSDPHGPKRKFGYDGYVYREIEISRVIDGAMRSHCVRVYHPAGYKTAEGKMVYVRDRIGPAWYRLIERTLARIPWLHLQQVEAIVIDNRPILHGVAPFSRGNAAEDARDGHTIWLNERLFTRPNHWAHGNYGHYWAYHVQSDQVTVAGQAPDHELFSPVLLHEIGHLVNYNLANGSASEPSCPPCARMCGDFKSCKDLDDKGKEAFCATAYCTGFGFSSGTENFAEMYRWYYQSSATRALLQRHFADCYRYFEDVINVGSPAPWQAGLKDGAEYRRTRWDSCRGGACKPY